MDYNNTYNKPYCGVSQPLPGTSGFFQANAATPTFLKVPNPTFIKQESVVVTDTTLHDGTMTPPVNYSQNHLYGGDPTGSSGDQDKPVFYRKPFEFQYMPNAYIQPLPQQFTPQHPHLHPHPNHHHLAHLPVQQHQVQQQQKLSPQQHPPPTVPSHMHSPQQQQQQQQQQVQHMPSAPSQPQVTSFHDFPDHSNTSSVCGSPMEPPAYVLQRMVVPVSVSTTDTSSPRPTTVSVTVTGGPPPVPPPPAGKESSRFTCDNCPKSFDSKTRLDKHMKVHASDEPLEFKCRMCDKTFRTKSTLICHEKVHGENGVDNVFTCVECGKVFATVGKLQVHRRLHTGEKPYQCRVCLKHFNHQSNLIVHSRIHEKVKQALKCDRCSKVLDDEERLAIHMRLHTGEKPYKCSYCDKRFNHKSTVSTHEKAAHIAANSFKCTRCHKTFNQKCQLQYHEKLQEEHTIACTLCEKVFCYKASHKEHMFKVHFPRPKKNQKKERTASSGPSETTTASNGEGRNKFKCTMCDRRFYYKRALEVHMGVHDASLDVNVLYFSCNYCPETFTDEGPLLEHEEQHVANGTIDFLQNMKALEQCENPANGLVDGGFRCPLCFKRFTDQQELRAHHKIHLCSYENCTKCGPAHEDTFDPVGHSTYDATEDGRETMCNICQRVLPSFEQFQNHFHYHTSRVPFYCYSCRVEFHDKRALYAHTKTHSPRELESYTCEVCAKVFSTKGNFKRHLKSHEAVRAFACDRCSKQYDYKSALEAHLKRSHGIDL